MLDTNYFQSFRTSNAQFLRNGGLFFDEADIGHLSYFTSSLADGETSSPPSRSKCNLWQQMHPVRVSVLILGRHVAKTLNFIKTCRLYLFFGISSVEIGETLPSSRIYGRLEPGLLHLSSH